MTAESLIWLPDFQESSLSLLYSFCMQCKVSLAKSELQCAIKLSVYGQSTAEAYIATKVVV